MSSCFWCDLPGIRLVNDTALCDSHAMCHRCLRPLTEKGITCACADYGYEGDQEKLWCSLECMDTSHPPSEPSEGDKG